MNNILLTLLSVSISGSVLSLLLFLLKPLIKDRVSKAFSYYIWLLILLRLMLPFGYIVSIPGIPQIFAAAGVPGYITPAENTRNTVEQPTEQQSNGNAIIVSPEENSAAAENGNLPTADHASTAGIALIYGYCLGRTCFIFGLQGRQQACVGMR